MRISARAFDPTLFHSQRELDSINRAAFAPFISAVLFEPSNQNVFLARSGESFVLPNTGFLDNENVRDAFARLIMQEMGMSPLAIARVFALDDPTRTESAFSDAGSGGLEQHVGVAAITEGMPSAPKAQIQGAEWVPLQAARDRLGNNNPNVMQRDMGVLLLDRFVASIS